MTAMIVEGVMRARVADSHLRSNSASISPGTAPETVQYVRLSVGGMRLAVWRPNLSRKSGCWQSIPQTRPTILL